jgi:hypothetical protein
MILLVTSMLILMRKGPPFIIGIRINVDSGDTELPESTWAGILDSFFAGPVDLFTSERADAGEKFIDPRHLPLLIIRENV